MSASKKTGLTFLTALAASTALLCAATAFASAAEPTWRLDSTARTSAAPNGSFQYYLEINNVGDAASSGDVTLNGKLPKGFSVDDLFFTFGGPPPTIHLEEEGLGKCEGEGPGDPLHGAGEFTCTITTSIGAAERFFLLYLTADVGPTAEPLSIASFEVSGGGAAPVSTVDPTQVSATPPPFGIDAFDAAITADRAGNPATQAAAHPYASLTDIDFNTLNDPLPLRGQPWPVEPSRDAVADLPPGFVGGTVGVDQCTTFQLANQVNATSKSLCPETSQVGTVRIRINPTGSPFPISPLEAPVSNMEPPPGAPAKFGFNVLGTVVTLIAKLRSSGDYGISVAGVNIPEGLALAGSSFEFWGVPSDSSHDLQRACPGQTLPSEFGPHCKSPAPPKPFFRNPTSCTGALPTTLHTDSWDHPGGFNSDGEPELSESRWVSATSLSHEAPGYPYPPQGQGADGIEQGDPIGMEGCDKVPFEPTIQVAPTINQADSPSGLNFDLSIPQECWDAKATVEEAEDALCQSDLRKIAVTLPQGMSINPAAADGLGACTPAQIGLRTPEGATPIHFDTQDPSCPDSSKIGTVKLKTPLLEEELEGAVYLAAQEDNPFDSLLALYIVIKGQGIIVKLPGKIEIDPATGRLTTVLDENPQTPFSHVHLELKSGPRAALITPPSCGTKTTSANLTPWSGNPAVDLGSSFQISQGPGGAPCAASEPFNPKLQAGSQSPLAGATTPFTLRLTRQDGEGRFASLDFLPPQGLTAYLKGVPYCPESQLTAARVASLLGQAELSTPSCPAASRVGTVLAGAGAGPNPFQAPGKAYLAGPYKGAPLSLAVFVPAVAGPFDLGDVLVRSAIAVDPETAQITVKSDPLPIALRDLPVDVRQIFVTVDRPHFTLNPTSCNVMTVGASVRSTQGASANPSDRFQMLGCKNLPFKPSLSFHLKGDTKRGGNPAFSATLRAKPGEANIARAAVTLPHSEFLDQAHIRTVCTRVQFAADACPAGSIYGHARAITPLLDQPLEGPVYLRSSNHKLPDLVADLNGQIHVALDGTIDSVKGGMIRNRFEVVPDAPVTKFTLTMQGGKKGLLQNSRNLCVSTNRVSVKLDGQNGKVHDAEPELKAAGCGGKARKNKKSSGRGRR